MKTIILVFSFMLVSVTFASPTLTSPASYEKGLTAFRSKEYQSALTAFEKAAEQGHDDAQYFVGLLYADGLGVPQDYQQSFTWYRKAAEQGHAVSQYHLGVAYNKGLGIAQDNKQAVDWFRKAAMQDNLSAQHNLGNMYYTGQGVPQDYAQAMDWFRKTAEQGFASSQYNLGYMYYFGQGVAANHEEGITWIRKAADGGDAEAQLLIGATHHYGNDTAQDYEQALAWYHKAAEQGNAEAQTKLGLMHLNGQGVEQDYAQAAAWFLKGAEGGNNTARMKLGTLYENGLGVEKSIDKALALYREGNLDEAVIRLTALKRKMVCSSPGSTKLFDVTLKCADRDHLMAAVKNAGANVIQEDKQNWGDTYHSNNILDGSSELYIGYTSDNIFAVAQYTFPGSKDTSLVTKIKETIAEQYGQPVKASSHAELGTVTHQWNLKDGIELNISRGWPDTTTYLTYTHPEHFSMMTEEQGRQRETPSH